MGLWPFGGGKKSRISRAEEKSRDRGESSPEDGMARKEKAGEAAPRPISRTSSKYDGFEKSRKQSKIAMPSTRTATYVASARTQNEENAGLGQQTSSRPLKLRKQNSAPLYQQNPTSDTSLGPENFSVLRPPTLNAKREDYDPAMARKKSSKRKAEEYAREREIKAMSSPIPIPKRPYTYSGGPLTRDTKLVPGDLNRRFSRPTSEISLPLPESLSENEDLSTQNSFKIGILAALSPRPTVKYDARPRVALGKRPAQSKISIQQAIQEEDPFSKRRIDDLADNLGSSDLRDLLERDKRRREKKRDAEKAKLQRKLQRRADRQKEEELQGGLGGEPVTPSRTGLGIDSDLQSSPPTARTRAQTSSSPVAEGEMQSTPASADPFADPVLRTTSETTKIRNPFEDEQDMDQDREPSERGDEGPPVPMKSPLREVQPAMIRSVPAPVPIQATMSPPTSPLQRPVDRTSFSQTSMLGRETTPDIPEDAELDRRTSDQSGQHLSSWTTFFRKGGRRKGSSVDKGRTTPSEFSNTSRESFQRQQPPPIVPPRSFKRADSGTPQRTQSRFREDLPELPMSPPDSRVQSPEAQSMPTNAALTRSASGQPTGSLSGTMDSRSLATSSSIPTLDRSRQENPSSQKQSDELDAAEAGPSTTAALSQSLASVDSEGSWLSGKPVKRLSGQPTSPLRQSQSSLRPHVPGDFEEAEDLTNDEYLNRLTPAPEERRQSSADAMRKASSTVIDLRKEGDHSPEPEVPTPADHTDETWHTGVGRQPTIIRQASRAKSKEGLLNEFKDQEIEDSSADDDASDHDIETPGEEFKDSPIMRATSVEYKGHARHISAGSARLLDIRRSSVQSESILRREETKTDASTESQPQS